MRPYSLTRPLAAHTLDERWFTALNDIGLAAGEVYTVLGPTADELDVARDAFTRRGFTGNVSQLPTEAGLAPFQDSAADLRQLRERIAQEETVDAVRRAYLDRIDELLCYLESVAAAKRGDAEGFIAANETIYGQPDAETGKAVIAWLHDFLERMTDHTTAPVRTVAKQAMNLMPLTTASPVQLLPDIETFNAVKRLHAAPGGYLDQLFRQTPRPHKDIITPENGDPIVRQVLHNISSDYALMDSPNNLWGVVHSRRAVLRPVDFHLRKADFYDLIVHEVGSHTLEYVNGFRSPLRLLATGLDRYDHVNEGRAYLREQLMHDMPDAIITAYSWQYHILIHLAIWLAYAEGYDFAGLYNLLYPLALVWEELREVPEPKAGAHHVAWGVLTRALKGTNGDGGAYYKDIIYVQGNVRCWQAARDDPSIILFGDNGKFDITRPKHLDILEAVGVSRGSARPSQP